MKKLKIIALALLVLAFSFSCKSSKKAIAASNAAAEKAKMEQEENQRKQKADELRRTSEENAKHDEQMAMQIMKDNAPKVKLNEYFDAIANSSNAASANGSINEALTMFSSSETPVLIVISNQNGQKDYDRPTTIRAYLNYLKDQKKNINNIGSLKVDDSGKITEVELTKNN